MSEKTYGYVRVSSREQNTDRQRIALRKYGVAEDMVIADWQSGKDFDRPGYRLLLELLQPGDTLVIKSIDRLGRSYEEILEQWRLLTKQMQVTVVVLDMPILNTGLGRDLTGTLIADIVLQLLSYVAQTERELIRQRQAEGIAAAKARGVRFGRKPLPLPPAFEAVWQEWRAGRLSLRRAAAHLGVDHLTFKKWAEARTFGKKSTV